MASCRPGLLRSRGSVQLTTGSSLSPRLMQRHCTSRRISIVRAESVQEQEKTETAVKDGEVERVTKKWGLEAGLFKAMTSKDREGKSGGQTAKELLAKYGSAYLITSISFALVSFVICYFLVDFGVDVAALLGKIGIKVSGAGERVGTFAIAYAAHKAASPIRFPPTVALTPVVANWIGQKRNDDADGNSA